MGTRKMFVRMWVIVGVICISAIAGGCAMPTSNVPTTPGPTQAPIDSATPIQPLATPSDLLPSTNSSEPSGSYGLTPVAVGSKYGYIDSTGKLIINPQFDDARYFSEGLAAVRIGSQETGKWGFIDQSGKFVINPQYDFNATVPSFSEGLAWVKVGDKYGYIDKSGELLINPQFETADDFSEGLARVTAGGKSGYIDKTGSFVINPQFFYACAFSEGLAGVIVEYKYGFIDKTGSFVVDPQFDFSEGLLLGSFSDGLAAVSVGYKYGYIDKTGSFIINPQFSVAADFSEGLAWASVGSKYGYIDRTGSFIINPQFSGAEDFSEGLAKVTVEHRDGYIDKTGSFVISPQFYLASGFSEGLAKVNVDDKWGYIDKTPEVRFVWNPDNIQLASEPSPQPSSPGPTIPTTQASSAPQSEKEQEAAIANALVEAFNTANPEPLDKYIEPYYRDDAYISIMLEIFDLRIEESREWINYSYDSLKPLWKTGTVQLVGFIRENYAVLRVKATGFRNYFGTTATWEYWIGTVNNSGNILIQSIVASYCQ